MRFEQAIHLYGAAVARRIGVPVVANAIRDHLRELLLLICEASKRKSDGIILVID